MSASFPIDGQHIIAGVLFVVYLALRLNVVPRIGGQRNSQIFLLVLLCVGISLNLRVHYSAIQRGFNVDRLLPVETSLRNLSQALPEGTRVGYVIDNKRSDKGAWKMRFLVQSAVAPRVLEDGAVPDWVIVDGSVSDPHLIPDGTVFVRDFGDGLMLFRRVRE